MMAALAFVPEPDAIIAFEAVSEDFPLDGQAVIDYFENTYTEKKKDSDADFEASRRST